MKRENYPEDPAKMQRLQGRPKAFQEMTPLPSFPLERQYPLTTPPTRLPREDKCVSPEALESPEIQLIDMTRQQILIQQSLSKWRESAMIQRKKREAFQESVTIPTFDVTERIHSLYNAHMNIYQGACFLKWRRNLGMRMHEKLAARLFQKKLLTKAFSTMQSRYNFSLQCETEDHEQYLQSTSPSRHSDIVGQLHTLLSQQAELETELEEVTGSINDLQSVTQDNISQDGSARTDLSIAQREFRRIQQQYNQVEQDYKNQIADLELEIHQVQQSVGPRLEEARSKLAKQTKAQAAIKEVLQETQATHQQKMTTLRSQLIEAQKIATKHRDAVIQLDQERQSLHEEIIELQKLLNSTTSECKTLEEQNNLAAENVKRERALQEETLQEAQQQLMAAKRKWQANQRLISDLEDQIADLDRRCRYTKETTLLKLQTYRDAGA